MDIRDNYIIPHRNITFWLNDCEMERARKFKKEHPARLYQYCFTPGPIGVYVEIKDDKEGQDITDYKTW